MLLAADWSKQLFDIAHTRTIRYPLADGDVGEAAAHAIRAAIKPKIEVLAIGGSPVFESIKGYLSEVDEADASTMKKAMAEMAAFQGRIRAVRAQPLSQRMPAAKLWRRGASADNAAVFAVIRLLLIRPTHGHWIWLPISPGCRWISRMEETGETLPSPTPAS